MNDNVNGVRSLPTALPTAAPYVQAPLAYSGKVRELYDLGEHLLIVATDRISAFDFILQPAMPDKGNILNRMSVHWFKETRHIVSNHLIHADIDQLGEYVTDTELLRDRVMVTKKAQRIDIECVVRGYLTGGGWRQFVKTGSVNGTRLAPVTRKNERLPQPLFAPATKNDVGHDEDISFEEMKCRIGEEQADILRDISIKLYEFAHDKLQKQGIILADCKFEFGLLDGEIILIDELFTPDCSRFWAREHYALDSEIDSFDKEPVRTYLANSDWDQRSVPGPLPEEVIIETMKSYSEIYQLVTGMMRPCS